MEYASLGEMFFTTCRENSKRTGMMFKRSGVYHSLTFDEMSEKAGQIAAGLKNLGVEKGDRVLILSENCVEWALADYAILSLGAVTVPIYPTLTPGQIEYIIAHSGGKILIISGAHQLQKLEKINRKKSDLKKIVSIDSLNEADVIDWQKFIDDGKAYLKKKSKFLKKSLNKVNREDLASIVYTSGTTGLPKGVMLTHGNFLTNIEGGLQMIPVRREDLFLSFLPLSHVFERMVGHFLINFAGAAIAYAESLETVGENIREVRPTLVAGVPRFYEKVYVRIQETVEEGSALKRKIFEWAIGVGERATEYRQFGKSLPGGLKRQYKIADRLVFSKLRDRVGGRVRLFVSGGAPLVREIARFFNAAGFTLLEGYGLSEASPVITANKPDKFKIGSGGLALPNVEVAIAEDGEILTRGSHVMKGYFKNEEETREAIDEEGWLHTGDIGFIDKDGFIFITDRKKNLIVTSGGKNIAPQAIENLINSSRYVDQSVVVGDRRKYCSALIVTNLDHLKKYAAKNGLDYESDDALLENPEILNLIRQEIDRVSADLASYETIKKFRLLSEPFTIENGELTPTLKVKRKVLETRYAGLISQMYPEN